MKFYIVRHGEAAMGDTDSDRVLTVSGREACKRMGKFLAGTIGSDRLEICHSPKARARETASILGEELAAGDRSIDLWPAGGLTPDEDPSMWIEKCRHLETDTMVVSHLPFVGKLIAGLLEIRSQDESPVAFSTCSVACLSRNGMNPWVLDWFATPATIPQTPEKD